MTIRGVYEVAIKVRDVARAETFYREVLGLTVGLRDERRNWVFLRAGPDGMIVLQQDDGTWPTQHFAFTVGDEEIDAAAAALQRRGCFVEGPVVHDWIPARSVYFTDPDGHDVELCAPGRAAASPEIPNVGEALRPVLQRIPRERQPLLIALAERLAAERYRGWAREADDATERAGLVACAEREVEIARRVEALYPEAAAAQRELLVANPDLLDVNRTLFAGQPVTRQYAIQAGGERLGSATWRAFARDETDPARADVLRTCARLEEESAEFLESVLRRGAAS